MFTPYVLLDPAHAAQSPSYGYGWFIDPPGKKHRMICHTGEINGFVAFNGFYPVDKLTLIVLSNLESSDLRIITDRLAGIILG
jgi:CubicO group peptidase (beta-lactamase class C family)